MVTFILSISILFGQNFTANNSPYPKRTIIESFDDSIGWFLYTDPVFIYDLFQNILDNLDSDAVNRVDFGMITIKDDKKRDAINSEPISYYLNINNWELFELFEWDVNEDRITSGVFLAKVKNEDIIQGKVFLFFDTRRNISKTRFVIYITATAPESEKLWNGYKKKLCRNCN